MKNKQSIDTLEKAMRFAQKHRTIPLPNQNWQVGIMDAIWQIGPYQHQVVKLNRTKRFLRRVIILSTSVAIIALVLCGYEYYRSASLIEYQALNDPAKLTMLAINK